MSLLSRTANRQIGFGDTRIRMISDMNSTPARREHRQRLTENVSLVRNSSSEARFREWSLDEETPQVWRHSDSKTGDGLGYRLDFEDIETTCSGVVSPLPMRRKSRVIYSRQGLSSDNDENERPPSTFSKIEKISRSQDGDEFKKDMKTFDKELELIGDYTLTFALPLVHGKLEDLKSITSKTLSKLIKGTYRNIIKSFMIIDCRYPYEFYGGHIIGAVNLHTPDLIQKYLLENKCVDEHKLSRRDILVFYCEFSEERSPFLLRYLRNEDRFKHDYPRLAYPEIYLLNGGYKDFYDKRKYMCIPRSYVPMDGQSDNSDSLSKKTVTIGNKSTNRLGLNFSACRRYVTERTGIRI